MPDLLRLMLGSLYPDHPAPARKKRKWAILVTETGILSEMPEWARDIYEIVATISTDAFSPYYQVFDTDGVLTGKMNIIYNPNNHSVWGAHERMYNALVNQGTLCTTLTNWLKACLESHALEEEKQ